MTQNKHVLKHPRVPDPQRVAKAGRGWLVSQAENAVRMEGKAPKPRPAWKDRAPLQGLSGSLAMRRRAAREPQTQSRRKAA